MGGGRFINKFVYQQIFLAEGKQTLPWKSERNMEAVRGEAWWRFAKTLKTKTATKEQPYKPKIQRKSPSGTCSKR